MKRLKRAEAAVAELRRDADLGVAYPGLLEVPGLDAAAAVTARIPLGTLAPDVVRPETEVKQITHAIRMTAYNAETALARAPHRHYAGAGDEACALIRGALTASGDVHIAPGEPLIRLDPLYAPRRTQAQAGLCGQLTAAGARYPGTDLVLRYEVKSCSSPA